MPALRPMSHQERILDVAREAGLDLASIAPRWPSRGSHNLTTPSQLPRLRALWVALMRGAQQPGIPIRIARRSSIDDCSLLGLAAKTAPDLRTALQRMHDYHAVWTGIPEIRFLPDRARRGARLEVLPIEGCDLAGRCRREMIVANLLQYARDMAGADLAPTLVHFAHGAPLDVREHVEFFAAPIRFGSHFSGLEFDSGALSRRLRFSDSALSNHLLANLDALAEERRSGVASVEQRVSMLLRERLETGPPAMEDLADELGMSARSLRRHLEARRTSYRELLDAVRREAAEAELREGTGSVADIAARLGFSEPSAFYRAFRRWTGAAPRRRVVD